MADIATLGFKVDTSGIESGEKALDNLAESAKKAETSSQTLGDTIHDAGQQIADSANNASVSVSNLSDVFGMLRGPLEIGAVIAFFASAIAGSEKLQSALLQTEALIKATGGAAGFSASQLEAQATELEATTLANKDAIMEAQQSLLTFKGIAGDTFTQTISLANDLASVTGNGLQSAVTTLGKALQDPVKGLSSLGEAGISFTEKQKDMVAAMVDAGNQAGAQTLILDELNSRIGGAAAAEADGYTGAVHRLGIAYGDLGQVFGDLIINLDTVTGAIDLVTEALSWLAETASTVAEEAGYMGEIWADSFAQMETSASGFGETIASDFGSLMNYLGMLISDYTEAFRIGMSYLPIWAGAAFDAVHSYGEMWGQRARSLFFTVMSVGANAFASLVDFAGSAFGAMVNIAGQAVAIIAGKLASIASAAASAVSVFNAIPGMEGVSGAIDAAAKRAQAFGDAAKNAGTQVTANFKGMGDAIRASGKDFENHAKIATATAQTAGITAQLALVNAQAFQKEAEGNRARSKEMKAVEAQFAEMNKNTPHNAKAQYDLGDAHDKSGKAAHKAAGGSKAKSDADKEAAKAAKELGKEQEKIANAFDREFERLEQGIIKYTKGEEAAYRYKLTKDHLTDGMQNTLVSMSAELDALEKEAKAREKVQKAYDNHIDKLDKEAAKLSLNEEGYLRYTLTSEGVIGAKQNEVVARQKAIDTMEEESKKNKELEKVWESVNKKMEDALVDTITGGKADWSGLVDYMIKEATRLLVVKPLMESLFGNEKKGTGGLISSLTSVFGFANGGIMTSGGAMPLNMYASGGVASSPQLAIFGEGSHNEAYVPLPDGRSIPVTMTGGVSSPVFNVNVVNTGTASVKTEQKPNSLGGIDINVMLEQIDAYQAQGLRTGNSQTADAMQEVFGVKRGTF